MFISKPEKEELRISVRTLQAKVKELDSLMAGLNERFDRLAAYAIKKKARVEELEGIIKGAQEIIKESDETFEVVFKKAKTAEAPWGYKKDGTPKKRPGRPMPLIAEGATV